jgi:hypothetical protein
MSDYPTPTRTVDLIGQVRLGWPEMPYYVEVSPWDTVYLAVSHQKGYRDIRTIEIGFIANPKSQRRMQAILRRYLRKAWRMNHSPAAHTQYGSTMQSVLEAEGIAR